MSKVRNFIKERRVLCIGIPIAIAAGLGMVALEARLVAQSALVPVDVAVPPVIEIFRGVGIGLIALGAVLLIAGAVATIRNKIGQPTLLPEDDGYLERLRPEASQPPVLPDSLFAAGAVSMSAGIAAIASTAAPVAADIVPSLIISASVLALIGAALLAANVGASLGRGR